MSRLSDHMPKEGDKVTFYYSNDRFTTGKVLYVAAGPGVPWVIQSYYEGKKGAVYIIQNFDRMCIEKP